MTLDNDELFEFTADDDSGCNDNSALNSSSATISTPTHNASVSCWTVLSVEDNLNFQASLTYSLQGLSVANRPIQLLTANSAAEAALVLAETHDIALILLDVVMEEDDSGLRLVETIRNTLGNQLVRIVLLTGQPGVAPRDEIVSKYDINEYWNKAELQDRLPSIVTTNLRSWQAMKDLEQAHIGLQMVVDASQNLTGRDNLQHFTNTVLEQIAQVIGIKPQQNEGVLCLSHEHACTAKIKAVSGSGCFQEAEDLSEEALNQSLQPYLNSIEEAINTNKHYFDQHYVVLQFSSSSLPYEISCEEDHCILLKTQQTLTVNHIRLLSVFSANVQTGFTNLMLFHRLRRLSYFDNSLDIYNRNWLCREIELLSPKQHNDYSLLLFGLDNFIERCLSFGHSKVESVLHGVYEQLHQRLPKGCVLVRISQSTLGVLCANSLLPSPAEIRQLTQLDIPLDNLNRIVTLTIAKLNLADVDYTLPAQEVIHLARTVLYEAGQNQQCYRVYNAELLTRIQGDFDLLIKLRDAIENDELCVFLQPKVRLNDLAPVGFEALVRWPQADGSFVSPGVFIPLAETSGLIQALDLQVLHKTLLAIQQLVSNGHILPVSCNATWSDLSNPDYMTALNEVAIKKTIEENLLELEITESQAMTRYQDIKGQLKEVRKLGFGISIDDFGTGYSSLAYLVKLPANTIKIDRSFVMELGTGSVGEHVTDIVVDLGRRFGYKVVAEGIETEQQHQRLQELNCEVGQGFLYAKPMAVSDALAWLKQRTAQHG